MNVISALGNVSIVIELFLGAIIAIYTVYAFLMKRQTTMLNNGFNTESARFLSMLATGHFLATIVLLLFAIVAILI